MKKQKPPLDPSKYDFTDMFGRPLRPGDFIVYGAQRGDSAALNVGQIIELTETISEYSDPVPKIRVKSWSHAHANTYHAGEPVVFSGRQKDVTLAFFKRMVVVHPDTVSAKVKADLEGPVREWNEHF